jgi:hypothetical protein
VELKISFARASREEKSGRRVGLALLVFVGNDVFLTISFIEPEKRWATKQRSSPDMIL